MTELAIVIPTKNEELFLPRLLASLTVQDYSLLAETPIIIADAGSTDGTLDAALTFSKKLRIMLCKGGSPAVGRNSGANLIESEFVLFLDADVVLYHRHFISQLISHIRDNELWLVTAHMTYTPTQRLEKMLSWCQSGLLYGSKFFRPFAAGPCMLFLKEAFKALGGFDESLSFTEDRELSALVPRKFFDVVPIRYQTSNRRIRRHGVVKTLRIFFSIVLLQRFLGNRFEPKDYW